MLIEMVRERERERERERVEWGGGGVDKWGKRLILSYLLRHSLLDSLGNCKVGVKRVPS